MKHAPTFVGRVSLSLRVLVTAIIFLEFILMVGLSQMNQIIVFLGLTAVVITYLVTLYGKKGSSKYRLPPLVPGIPIFGNALQVPPTQQGPWAKELAEKYGEM